MSCNGSTTNMFHLNAVQIRSGGCGAVNERRSVMRSRTGILALVMALMLMSMAGISAIAQDATPEASPVGSNVCGPNIPIFAEDALPRPEGVDVIFACGY